MKLWYQILTSLERRAGGDRDRERPGDDAGLLGLLDGALERGGVGVRHAAARVELDSRERALALGRVKRRRRENLQPLGRRPLAREDRSGRHREAGGV